MKIVADPGFPSGRRQPRGGGGTNLLFGKIFADGR